MKGSVRQKDGIANSLGGGLAFGMITPSIADDEDYGLLGHKCWDKSLNNFCWRWTRHKAAVSALYHARLPCKRQISQPCADLGPYGKAERTPRGVWGVTPTTVTDDKNVVALYGAS